MPTVKGVVRRLRPRKLHVYGIGNEKTGTTSLYGLYRNHIAGHEPHVAPLIELIERHGGGHVAGPDVRRFLRYRDLVYRYELESSGPLIHVAGQLASMFPRARFVLTVRHPATWWVSVLNQKARHAVTAPHWVTMHGLHYAAPPTRWDEPLLERGYHPLGGMLGWWSTHNQMAFDAVPSDRLLVVKVEELDERIEDLAAFTGVDPATLVRRRSRMNVDAVSTYDASLLDAGYVADQLEQHCGHLARRLGYAM